MVMLASTSALSHLEGEKMLTETSQDVVASMENKVNCIEIAATITPKSEFENIIGSKDEDEYLDHRVPTQFFTLIFF